MARTNVLRWLRIFGIVVCVAGTCASAHAATITIVNNDGAGEGFNDGTARASVGGNPGTTLGAQRLYVFQYAAGLLGAVLPSDVTILVRAQFNPLTCSASSAVLGSAGPVTIHRDFAGAPLANTWYHQALANKLAGIDQSLANPDISATFNLTLDSGTCLGGITWYYGVDGNEGAGIELLPVVLHELSHGLGFSTNTSGVTGAFNGGYPSVFDHFLLDLVSGLHWDAMSDAQRVASAISLDQLVWDGPWATTQAGNYLGPRPELVVNSPEGITPGLVALPAFGPQSFSLTGNVVLAVDGGGSDPNDACEALTNGAALAGNIALIDRGTCLFTAKCAAAQAAGAIGVLVANNSTPGPAPMGGADPSIVIPCLGISLADGDAIKAALLNGPVNVTMDFSATLLAGADGVGRPLMYTPNPYQSGSSVSHWDVTLAPNALMEPAINSDLHDALDLTVGLFADIGWQPNSPTAVGDGPAAQLPAALAVRVHPNPFTSTTSLALGVPVAGHTSVRIYDLAGRLVRTLVDEARPAGTLVRTWDGRDDGGVTTAAGVYIARLQVGDRMVQGKFVRVR